MLIVPIFIFGANFIEKPSIFKKPSMKLMKLGFWGKMLQHRDGILIFMFIEEQVPIFAVKRQLCWKVWKDAKECRV